MTANRKSQGDKKRFWTPVRIAFTSLVLSLIAVTGISSCTSSDEKENRSAGSQPAAKAPVPPRRVEGTAPAPGAAPALSEGARSAKLKTTDGGTITLAEYSGKVVVVNLWATWCGPCRHETPELVKLHKEFQSQGVEMVGLSIEDPESSADSVKEFVRNFQVDYHVGWSPRELTIALYEVEPARDAIPQSFVISRDGRVLKKFVGFNPDFTPPQMKQAIEDALKGA